MQAYIATDYQVYPTSDKTLHIRINQINSELNQYLEEHQPWAYITAWNPQSKPLSATENTQRNQALEKELQAKGLTYYTGKGVPDTGDWVPEESFLILGLSKKEAIKMGQVYEQKAIVWGKRAAIAELIFLD